MNSFVHEVPEFFRQLVPDIECVFSTPVSNIGPSVPGSIPGTHETTGTWGPGLYYFGRLGPVVFQLGAVAQIPINHASGRGPGAIAILDLLLDDMFPDSIGKPLFGPRQARGNARLTEEIAMQRFLKLLLAAGLAAPLAASPVFAHAFLDHGVPGVWIDRERPGSRSQDFGTPKAWSRPFPLFRSQVPREVRFRPEGPSMIPPTSRL